MLVKRIVSAAILIPIVGLAAYWGGWALLSLVVLVALGAGYEYVSMLRSRGYKASYLAVGLFVLLALIDAQWPQFRVLPVALVFLPILVLTQQVFRGNAPGCLDGWALTLAGSLYIGILATYFIKLRMVENGFAWLALALIGTWIADTGAYLVGCTIGRHPFFPKISPKKTLEGAVGELVFGVVTVVLLGYWLLGLGLLPGIVLGILLVLGAIFGDLAESVIKRQVGIKDSGNLIPGHGGALDRIDSLLFVIPIVYYFVEVLAWLRR